MKLKIGNVIRDKRRAAELTQEELAAKLGVSFQAVSRWENGAAYPDLELLPVLAGLFSVTVDELLGKRQEERIRAYQESIYDCFRRCQRDEELNLCRNAFAEFPGEFDFADRMREILSIKCGQNREKYIDELRSVAYDILERCPDFGIRSRALYQLSIWEDDDKIAAFLDRYAAARYSNDRITLLCGRYRRQGKSEAYRAAVFEDRIDAISRVLYMNEDPTPSLERDPAVGLPMLYTKLDFLNALIGVDAETRRLHPIIGDGTPDSWYTERIYIGVRIAARLAALGRMGEALTALEEITNLIERLYALEIGDTLSFRTDPDGLGDLTVVQKMRMSYNIEKNQYYTHFHVRQSDENAAKFSAYHLLPYGDDQYIHIGEFLRATTAREGWEWFDPIREHPRYIACVERVKETVDFGERDRPIPT